MRSSRLDMALQTGALVVPDTGMIGVYGARMGDDLSMLPQDRVQVVTGFRPDYDHFAGQYAVRHEGTARYAAAIVCLPRAREQAHALLAQASAEVMPGGMIAVDGQKTDGVDSALKDLRGRVAVSDTLSKAHGKLFTFAAGEALADWAARPRMVDGFQTLPGVFSADGPDEGSALLAAALPALKGRVADLGAGWGYLTHAVLQNEGVKSVEVVEADFAALTCAKANITDARARFHWADATAFRPDTLMDAVVMNPPFHVGRTADPALGMAFIRAAKKMLTPGGSLYMVANRMLPYDKLLPVLFREVIDLGSTNAFRLTQARAPVREGKT
jgi:16S rRNA (guanine1207-N2)-methyltransferase